jgi:hypothetical protein
MTMKPTKDLGVTVRVSAPLYKKLKAAAAAYEISMSQLTRVILEHAIREGTFTNILKAEFDARVMASREQQGNPE